MRNTSNYYYGRKRTKPPKSYPKVTTRVSQNEGENVNVKNAFRGLHSLGALFPFHYYGLIDELTKYDPYISKYHHTTVSLGNTGHKLELNAGSEARATAAIHAANEFASRCFAFSGGLDGLVNALLSQLARAGGLCVEWVPDSSFNCIEQAFVIPIKTIRFEYEKGKDLPVLFQIQDFDTVKLNPVQTTFYASTIRDGNPYPVPPALAAIESCGNQRKIMNQINRWVEKVSSLGVLLAEVEPPPRNPGESQEDYDRKAETYLSEIASSISQNLDSGLGVGYNNIKFTFNNTQSGAQGAKDLLQTVLQGLFAALHRDPVFFGWNFNSTETFAKVVYEEMIQGVLSFQLGVKRALENGHRLNLALQGFGDVGISINFKKNRSIDSFRDAEAKYMETQAVLAQLEQLIITPEEARRLLGHDEKQPNSGEFVASFVRSEKRYILIPPKKSIWSLSHVDKAE